MNPLIPYLIFTGECREALQFYCEILGGEVTLMHSMADSPIPVPEAHGHLIFNAEMRAGDLVIKASDNLPGNETITGSNFSLFCNFSDAEKQVSVFNQLLDGGRVMFPLENGFGMLKDRYGIQWMLASEGA